MLFVSWWHEKLLASKEINYLEVSFYINYHPNNKNKKYFFQFLYRYTYLRKALKRTVSPTNASALIAIFYVRLLRLIYWLIHKYLRLFTFISLIDTWQEHSCIIIINRFVNIEINKNFQIIVLYFKKCFKKI